MTKHMKNYSVVKNAMKKYFEREENEARKRLAEVEGVFGNPEFWDDEHKCYRFNSGNVCYESDAERAREHLEKFLPKYRSHWEERFEAADKAGKLLEINISVHWSRSRTWGMNPHAEAWICFTDEKYGTRSAYGEGRASGCGYDKRSAAIGDALCMNAKKKDDSERKESCRLGRAAIDRFVIEHGEALWKQYAIDRTPFPHFSIGAKGFSVFTSLFRRIGCKPYCDYPVSDFLIDYSERDSGSDVYHVIRKDRI